MSKESSIDKIVSPIALLCIGICLIVWADQVTDWIVLILGVIALIYALGNTIRYAKTAPAKRSSLSLFYIILSACVGILLVSRADFIKEAISFIIGVYIILTCSTQLLGASALHHKTGMATKSYIWPIIGIIIGILCITGRFIIPNELARLTGVALIIYAIIYLTGFTVIKKEVRKATPHDGHARIKDTATIKEAEIVEPKESKQSHSKKSKK